MIGAIIGGIGALLGGAASGAAGLLSGAVSGIGSLGAGALSTVGSLFAAPAAATSPIWGKGLSVAEIAMAEQAAAGVDILGGVASATGPTLDYLSEVLPKGLGLYQILNPPKEPAPTVIRSALPATSATVPQLPLQLFGTQREQSVAPMIITTPSPVTPAQPNYLIYAIIAIVAILLLRK